MKTEQRRCCSVTRGRGGWGGHPKGLIFLEILGKMKCAVFFGLIFFPFQLNFLSRMQRQLLKVSCSKCEVIQLYMLWFFLTSIIQKKSRHSVLLVYFKRISPSPALFACFNISLIPCILKWILLLFFLKKKSLGAPGSKKNPRSIFWWRPGQRNISQYSNTISKKKSPNSLLRYN